MVRLNLSKSQMAKIAKLRKETKEVVVHMRLTALLWLGEGMTVAQVAQLIKVVPRTIKNWVKLYQKGGLDGLCKLKYKGDPGQLNQEQKKLLDDKIMTGVFRSVKQIVAWVKEQFEIEYSLSGMKALLQRMDFTYHKVKGLLWRGDLIKQREFARRYHGQRSAARRARSKKVRTYFVDACHPVWGLNLNYSCWAKRGQEIWVKMGGGRKRYNILGAYSPDDQEYLDLRKSEGTIGAIEFIELLEKMVAKHPNVEKFYVYADNARYFKCKLVSEWLANHRQVCLEFLPPYSPNLNLIERLWRFMKQEALKQPHGSFESMRQAIDEVLNNMSRYKDELTTLMREKFQILGTDRTGSKSDVETPALIASAA